MKKIAKFTGIIIVCILSLMFILPFAFQDKIKEIVIAEGNKMLNAEFGFGIIGFSSSHTHLSEKDYSFICCDSEHAYGRKTFLDILSCPDTIHSNSFNVGPISVATNRDISVSLGGSVFAIVGVGGSVGINLSEFVRGVFE